MQRTTVKSCSSAPQPVLYGVPQGSVLGPLLFVVYMTRLKDVMTHHPTVEHMVYADDIQLFIASSPQSLPDAVTQLEACICDV